MRLRAATRILPRRILTSLLNIFNPSFKPTKHIKIDDEERQTSPLPPHHPRPMLKLLFLILLAILFLLLVIIWTIYKPPTWLVTLVSNHNPSVLFHVPLSPKNHVVALTIDDAPSKYTGEILDLLKKYNAHATFFIIGSQISSHPGVIERIQAEGHELGNHAWRDEPSVSLPLPVLRQQVEDVEELLLSNKSGIKWFRPGSGYFNKRMLEVIEGMGYKMALGDIFPFDPVVKYARVNAWHVLSMLKSRWRGDPTYPKTHHSQHHPRSVLLSCARITSERAGPRG